MSVLDALIDPRVSRSAPVVLPIAAPISEPFTGRHPLLDPLRGLACLWVFLFHYHFSGAFQRLLPGVHDFLKVGDLGVPVFFVISGYCLASAARRALQTESLPLVFLGRRAKRIYPAFWCSIGLILAVRMLFLWGEPFFLGSRQPFCHHLPNYGAGDWLRVVTLTRNFSFEKTPWWGRFSEINGAYWTLALEAQFYVILGAALWLPKHFERLLLAVTVLALPCYFVPSWYLRTATIGSVLPYWLWFACGLAVYRLLESGLSPRRVFGSRAPYVAIAYGVALVAVTQADALYRVRPDRLAYCAAFAVFVWLADSLGEWWEAAGKNQSVIVRLPWNALTFLGTMSYSFYLVHNEVSYGWRRLFSLALRADGVLCDAAVVAATIAVTAVFFHFCERPFLQSAKRPTRLSEASEFSSPGVPSLSEQGLAA